MDCIFCEIANGSIPGKTLYEDELVRVILDINPASAGHALIMPKKHAASLLECDPESRNRVFEVAAALGKAMEEKLNCDGINVLANIREGAGQTVDHFHVHLIPRYSNAPEKDGFSMSQKEIEKPDLDALCELLKLN